MPVTLHDFQRNTAFVLFVLVVVSTAFLFLLERLRALLVPLIWAFFFAIPVLSFADWVETLTILLFDRVAVWVCGSHSSRTPLGFSHTRGQNRIYLDKSEATLKLLQRLRASCGRRCLPPPGRCSCVGWLLARLDRCLLSRLWGQRLKIKELPPERGGDPRKPAVGGLVAGRSYYAFPSAPGELLAGDTESTAVELELYLDRQKAYPAVVVSRDSQGDGETVLGMLEVDRRSSLSWAISVAVAFWAVGLIAWGFVVLIGKSVQGVSNNFDNYKRGVEDLTEDIKRTVHHIVPGRFLDEIKDQLLTYLTNFGKDVASDSVMFIEGTIGQIFLFCLYVMFWIVEPLPIKEPTAKVFKDYMMLKTLVCLLFAGFMAFLLHCLGCPVWPLYFFLSFLLNYIPEIGPILAGLLMLPAVLLDAEYSKRDRYGKMTILVIVGTLAKIITGNIIEVKLYSRFGGEFMRIHPVVLFVFFTLCGYQLGPTGMFISVPILGALKYSLVSRAVPEQYLHALLTLIEGDLWAAHKNLARKEATRAARDEAPEVGSEELGGGECREMVAVGR